MNSAHLHIMLVHAPIVLIPLGLLLHLVGKWRVNHTLSQVADFTFILGAVAAVPGFLLGEGAEELVEDIAGISKRVIHDHEEAAELAIWLVSALGIVSLFRWVISLKGAALAGWSFSLVFVLGVVTTGSLAYTANLGGKVRHPEAYDLPTAAAGIPAERHSDKE